MINTKPLQPPMEKECVLVEPLNSLLHLATLNDILRWQWCLSLLVADFNSRVICQRQPGPSSFLTKMFMGWVSVAFMEGGYRNFSFFCLLQSHGPNERSNERLVGVGEGKGWVGTGFLHYRSEWFPLWHNSGSYSFSISLLCHAA
ncbi:hypothetical protein CEXT_96151 [Caerostris extrusa]|uniref:Uncharacterized protein n=1 Tax=Caerostris extrusa TaxID=172846 RepID=A0AAV4W5X4_CAEEX|nr:hypothetical protein CEXT_96151 [Caerostris extrusa]